MLASKIHRIVIISLLLLLQSITNGYSAEKNIKHFATSPLSIASNSKVHTLTVELAATEAERQQGLMWRKTLAANKGMLFIFPDTRTLYMWMKNTRISLDMVFIDEAGTIIHIAEHTKPMSEKIITTDQPAKAVLELSAGTCKRLAIQIGDKVQHETFSNTAHH